MMDNVLCGHVLASRKSVPWLYVLPIFDILNEVKATLSCSEVVLPQSRCQPRKNVLMDETMTSFASGSSTIFTGRADQRSSTQQQSETTNPPPQIGSDAFHLSFRQLGLVTKTDILRTCLGSMYVENASTAPLNYSAYEDYYKSTLEELVENPLLSSIRVDKALLLEALQMIQCGLHKHIIIATMQQRSACGPAGTRSLGGVVDRAASLLVMVDIGDNHELGCRTGPQRVPWAHGNLRDKVSTYFDGQLNLYDMDIRLDPTFTMESLVRIAGLRISWTANLADHLRLDSKEKVLHVFHHVTFLHCQRMRYQIPFLPHLVFSPVSLAARSIGDQKVKRT